MMSTLTNYAKRELELAGMFSEDGDFYGGLTGDAVMELIEVFEKQGHSGMSAGVALSVFSKVAMYKLLSPIRGSDDEWNELEDGDYQNKRLSSLFKTKDGCRFNGAIVWEEKSGGRFYGTVNGIKSSQPVNKFPFIPKTFCVKVDGDKIIDKAELERALKYYS